MNNLLHHYFLIQPCIKSKTFPEIIYKCKADIKKKRTKGTFLGKFFFFFFNLGLRKKGEKLISAELRFIYF